MAMADNKDCYVDAFSKYFPLEKTQFQTSIDLLPRSFSRLANCTCQHRQVATAAWWYCHFIKKSLLGVQRDRFSTVENNFCRVANAVYFRSQHQLDFCKYI